jgi:hypothetical protein
VKKSCETRTLQHKAKILYEWQRKNLEEKCEGAWTWADRGVQFIKESSIAFLTVNKYYIQILFERSEGVEKAAV